MPRPSPVSDAVRSLFEAGGRHAWSIDELHDTVRSSLGGADYSTVFRAVAGLEREGVIQRLEVGDGKAHYELQDSHHDHVRCDSCGRLAEVPGCVLAAETVAVQRATGFRVLSHQLVFTGLCPDCTAAG
ncbi:MAG: transcriptional repressor [Chloroflexi bacterium]|nr:MAG: transcriptional repressor [Chloroflexota bacterium]TMD54095.1 MAG: transcriptional repressor [Chloroflexota bacterium]